MPMYKSIIPGFAKGGTFFDLIKIRRDRGVDPVLRQQFAHLFRAMRTGLAPAPDDLAKALGDLPPVGTLPSPWLSVPFVCVLHYHFAKRRAAPGRRFLPLSQTPC